MNPEQHPGLVDQSWLTDQSCSAPCWYGLEPGKSSEEEAIAVTKALSFIGDEKVLDNTIGSIAFLCKLPSDKNCTALQFEDGILSELWLYPNYYLTVEQVVEKIGPPESFYYIRNNPESKGCSIKLLWIDRRMSIGHGEKSHIFGDDLCDLIFKESGKLPKDLVVQTVNLMTLDQMNEFIQVVQEPGTGQNYMLWNGFVK